MSDAGTGAGGNGAVPWFQSPDFDEDHRAYAQTQGWDRLPAEGAARAAAKAHREAQRLLRAPQDEIVRIPKNAAPDGPEMQALYQRLGAPPDPSGYKFDEVKLADGTPAPPEYIEPMRNLAAELHLPVAAATAVAARALAISEKRLADATAAQTSAAAQATLAELDGLYREWGAEKDLKLFQAGKAAERIGLTADFVTQMQKSTGAAATLKAMVNLYGMMSEPELLRGGGGPGSSGRMTPEAAQARIQELMKDLAWGAKYRNPNAEGHSEAVKEWTDLQALSIGQRPR